MGITAVAGGILGLLVSVNRDDDQGFVALFVIASLVVVVPAHFAIEANRRDAFNTCHGGHRFGQRDTYYRK